MAVTKTIKPGGGGDYTSLSSWWTWASAQSTADIYIAECYGGGDLGTIAMTSAGFTPDATHYFHIRPASGERHAGTWNTNKAKCVLTGSSFYSIFDVQLNYTRIEGIQIQGVAPDAGFTGVRLTNCNNVSVDKMLFDIDYSGWNPTPMADVADGCVGMTQVANAGLMTIKNNIFFMRNSSSLTVAPHPMVRTNALDFSGGSILNIYNNSFYCKTQTYQSWAMWLANYIGTNTLVVRNNIASNFFVCYAEVGGSGWGSVTKSNNISSDGTLGTTEAASSTFNDPANFDLSLLVTSAAFEGGYDLSGSGVTDDAVYQARPYNTYYDIGALESTIPTYTVAPPAGTITLTGQVPTLTITDSVTISPPAGTITLTGEVPSVVIPERTYEYVSSTAPMTLDKVVAGRLAERIIDE